MIELKTRTELDAMREAGRVVAAALAAVREQARVGVTSREIAEVARTVIHEGGAKPLFPGYHPTGPWRPFPGAVCVSLNDAVVYGIPGGVRIADGDLVSIDCAARLDGWCGTAAITFSAGTAVAGDPELTASTTQALDDGVGAARPGARIGDISRTIGVVGRSAGYGIPGPLGGYGIGRDMREAPFVANDGRPGRGTPLRPGMVLVLAPMFLAGGRDSIHEGENGWTRYTGDGSRAAYAGHTVAITQDGPEILTLP